LGPYQPAWTDGGPFQARVLFSGASQATDLAQFRSAVICFSYGTPSCLCPPGVTPVCTGDNGAVQWQQSSTVAPVLNSSSEGTWVTITFIARKPGGGIPDGTGKGIIIITQAESGVANFYQVGGGPLVLDDPR
jgi:hypothetical protein